MNRQNFNWYFILCFILLLGIFAFYLSCQSKSPTDPAAALPNQVSAQSTNNTTTSSSTTTTIQPGNPPTNTTSLITSRYLTTTSTSTTSTSTTSTSTTTTSIPYPILEWCSVTINRKAYYNRSYYYIPPGSNQLIIGISIKNVGTAPAQKVAANLYIEKPSAAFFRVVDGYEYLGTIPDDKKCYGSSKAFYMEVDRDAYQDWCWIHIVINAPGCKNCSIDYYIYVEVSY